jgi:hypothetical protein
MARRRCWVFRLVIWHDLKFRFERYFTFESKQKQALTGHLSTRLAWPVRTLAWVWQSPVPFQSSLAPTNRERSPAMVSPFMVVSFASPTLALSAAEASWFSFRQARLSE